MPAASGDASQLETVSADRFRHAALSFHFSWLSSLSWFPLRAARRREPRKTRKTPKREETESAPAVGPAVIRTFVMPAASGDASQLETVSADRFRHAALSFHFSWLSSLSWFPLRATCRREPRKTRKTPKGEETESAPAVGPAVIRTFVMPASGDASQLETVSADRFRQAALSFHFSWLSSLSWFPLRATCRREPRKTRKTPKREETESAPAVGPAVIRTFVMPAASGDASQLETVSADRFRHAALSFHFSWLSSLSWFPLRAARRREPRKTRKTPKREETESAPAAGPAVIPGFVILRMRGIIALVYFEGGDKCRIMSVGKNLRRSKPLGTG